MKYDPVQALEKIRLMDDEALEANAHHLIDKRLGLPPRSPEWRAISYTLGLMTIEQVHRASL